MTKKETLAQVFSFELCEISKKNFSYRTPPMATSGNNFTSFRSFLLNSGFQKT